MADQLKPFFPPIPDSVPQDVAQHLHLRDQLIFDKFNNHFSAIQTQQTQIQGLQEQLKALQEKK